MSKTMVGLAVLGGTLLMTGCFDMPSLYPIYTSENLVSEPKLLGVWRAAKGDDMLVVEDWGDQTYRATHIDGVGWAQRFDVRLVMLGDMQVADVFTVESKGGAIPGHYFVSVSWENDELALKFLDSERLRQQAAREGIGYTNGEDFVALVAQAKVVRQFLKTHGGADLAGEADLRFKRVY